LVEALKEKAKDFNIPIIGITGTGGAGKSSLTDELVRRFLRANPDKKIAIISVDPSKKKTGGALLGDRIRMNSINDKRVYMRSMATRENNVSVSPYIHSALDVLKISNPDIIILETSGIGQSGSEITEIADVSMYVMTPEYGASTQLEKIDMLDYADLIALNKSDKRGALDAIQAVRKQFQRNHQLWETPLEEMPVFSTKASQFNDWGTTALYNELIEKVNAKFTSLDLKSYEEQNVSEESTIIPPKRVRYLSEIVDNNKNYDKQVEEQALIAKKNVPYRWCESTDYR
jgi:methylmalonyl-CoA mutase